MIRKALFALTALLVACSSTKPRPEEKRAERVAACDIHCANLAAALVEQGIYDEARAPLERAWEHVEDPGRDDIPWGESERYAMRVQLAVLDAVIARHTDGDAPKALRRLWEEAEQFLGSTTFEGLRAAELTFLTRSDRRWVLRSLKATEGIDAEARILMTLVWRSNSNMSVDRLLLKELSKKAETPQEHLMSVFLFCNDEYCDQPATIRHMAGLLAEQMSRPTEEVDRQLMEEDFVRVFMSNAGPRHRDMLLWIRDYAAESKANVQLAIPGKAFGKGEACRRFSGALVSIVRDSQASYDALVEAGGCALALDWRSWALNLLRRARKLRDRPVEALQILAEYEAIQLHHTHVERYVEDLEEIEGSERAARIRDLSRAIEEGRLADAKGLLAMLPESPASLWGAGMVAFMEGNYEAAIGPLEKAFEVWPSTNVGVPLLNAYLRIGATKEAMRISEMGKDVRPSRWTYWHGLAAAAAGETETVEKMIEMRDDGQLACYDFGRLTHLVTLARGRQAGEEWLRSRVEAHPTRRARKCAGGISWGFEIVVPAERTVETLESWKLDQDVRDRIIRNRAPCTGGLGDAKLELYRESESASKKNNIAWCLAKRGEFEEALEVLPEPRPKAFERDTFARILLGLGQADRAVEIFRDLRDDHPVRDVYRAHWLAAALNSSHPPTRREVDVEVSRLAAMARLGGLSFFTYATLVESLERHGYEEEAGKLRRTVAQEAGHAYDPWEFLGECEGCAEAYERAHGYLMPAVRAAKGESAD
jgi:tetratricopeptide (TPR) repeat protein